MEVKHGNNDIQFSWHLFGVSTFFSYGSSYHNWNFQDSWCSYERMDNSWWCHAHLLRSIRGSWGTPRVPRPRNTLSVCCRTRHVCRRSLNTEVSRKEEGVTHAIPYYLGRFICSHSPWISSTHSLWAASP